MRTFSVLLVVVAMIAISAAKDEFHADDFVKRHLNSIGNEPARAAVKNRLAQGPVIFRVVQSSRPPSGVQSWGGEQTLVSEGNKFTSLLKFPASAYRTERFVGDGKKTSVDQATASVLGRFVTEHNEILREGLWGGTLSTGWALSRWNGGSAKLEDRGLKKIDGRQLHRVDYVPKKSSDLKIELYFEPDTFRHVMTVYSLTVGGQPNSHGLGADGLDRENQGELRYRLEEHFADFKNIDNLTLPVRWTIRFTYGWPDLPNIDQFDVTEEKMSHNISLDAKDFEVK